MGEVADFWGTLANMLLGMAIQRMRRNMEIMNPCPVYEWFLNVKVSVFLLNFSKLFLIFSVMEVENVFFLEH